MTTPTNTYTYPFPCAYLTADVVVIHKPTRFLLVIERGVEPFKGQYALPGGHLDVASGESLVHCATRELREETGLNLVEAELELLGVYDKPERDPREVRRVGIAYVGVIDTVLPPDILAGDDAARATWIPLEKGLDGLAFDHSQVVQDAILHLDW